MAKFTVTGLDDVMEAMLRQEAIVEEAVPEMLKAGGEVIKRAFQTETEKLNSTGRATGDLTASIKVSAVKERNGGKYVEIAPTGKDRHGVRNAEKGFVHPLHSAEFDFDESILTAGVQTYVKLLQML